MFKPISSKSLDSSQKPAESHKPQQRFKCCFKRFCHLLTFSNQGQVFTVPLSFIVQVWWLELPKPTRGRSTLQREVLSSTVHGASNTQTVTLLNLMQKVRVRIGRETDTLVCFLESLKCFLSLQNVTKIACLQNIHVSYCRKMLLLVGMAVN